MSRTKTKPALAKVAVKRTATKTAATKLADARPAAKATNGRTKIMNEQFTRQAKDMFKVAQDGRIPENIQAMAEDGVTKTRDAYLKLNTVAKDGAKVAYTFNQALLDYDCYAIPKGAPNKDLAMKFLAEITKAPYQAEFTKYITYGPTNKKAYDLGTIDPVYAKRLPSHPDNTAKQLPVNLEWYIKYEAKASELYQNMLTE